MWLLVGSSNFVEVNRYFALTPFSFQRNDLANERCFFLSLGFLVRENDRSMFKSFHLLADKDKQRTLTKVMFNEGLTIIALSGLRVWWALGIDV